MGFVKGGTSESFYYPYSGDIAVGGIGAAYSTVLYKTSSGYLSKFLALPTITNEMHVKIVLDGNIIIEIKSVNNNIATGFTIPDYVHAKSDNTDGIFILGTLYSLPDPALFPDSALADSNNHIVLPQPLYYRESLLIQIKAGGAETAYYTYAGADKV